MDSFISGQSVKNHLLHDHVLTKHYSLGAKNLDHFQFGPRSRIYILLIAGLICVSTILLKRILSIVPFFPPKDYRSYKVVNKKDFLYLYSINELPSQAAVEPLNGTRLGWAYATAAVFAGLLVTLSIELASRAGNELPYHEGVAELLYYGFLSILWGFRFTSTPYRNLLYLTVGFSSIIPAILSVQRDVWPKLLYHPAPDQLMNLRDGITAHFRLGLSLILLLCFLFTPRLWYPVDPYNENEIASPEQIACLASYILSYSWIGGLVLKAFRKDIGPEDLPPIPDYDRARLWGQKILKDQKTSTFFTLLSLMRYDLCFMTISSFMIGWSKFISPWAMKELLAYIERSKEPTISPWVYVSLLFVGPLVSACLLELYVFNSTRLIVRVKAALTQSLLLKTLKIRFTAGTANKNGIDATGRSKEHDKTDAPDHQQTKVGMINNLMSTDLEQMTDARDFFLLFGSAPIELVLAVVFLYQMLGWSSLVGVAMMVGSMVVPGFTARKLASIQTKERKATDARIGLMNEVLNSIRIVKFFGLENAFMNNIKKQRDIELKYSITATLYGLVFYTVTSLLPIINMLVTFGLYTNVMKRPLSASITFTSISLFGILRGQFSWVAFIVRQILYAHVSFKRIDKFLNEEEELEMLRSPPPDSAIILPGVPCYRNATLSWHVPGSDSDNGFRLSNLNVECTNGGLTVVSGPVGSGKTSFLLGLLGEMRLLEGGVMLPRNEGVAYVSQTPWLQNATIQENILFGSTYEEQRYKAVIDACALAADIEMFEAGDSTEVGERGVTLSGGQKARLALARAIYSPAKIVLLDDVLSALDAGTIKTVFEKCIKGEILKNRTVVLVTHHVSLVAPAANKIVVLSSGAVVSAGPPTLLPELLGEGILKDAELEEVEDLSRIVAEDVVLNGEPVGLGVSTSETNATTQKAKGKLVLEEERAVGRVPKKMILGYIGNLGGPFFIALLVGSSFLLELASLGNTFFVGLWSDAYRNPDQVNVNAWLAAYAILLISISILTGLSYGLWYWAEWLASRVIHEKLVQAVLYAPIRFFDTTPLGRIINRFSKDVKSVDDKLGPYLQYSFVQVLEIAMLIIVLSGLIPTFLIPTIFVCIVGFACGEMYVRAQMGVKRLVSVKESPLISHFNDTISGVITIRAFSCQKRFLLENLKRIDDYTLPQQTLYNLNRWIGVRINGLTAVVGVSAGTIALTSTDIPPGLIGFSLTNALAFSSTILYAVRYFNALEIELNSLERINEYVNLKQETPATPEKQPPASWPTDGDVEVRDLSVRYSDDGPVVLSKVSFNIKPRERIGVVGRTGAGKSSLALSLLRFTIKSEGSIIINGRDIEDVNLDVLRQRITIIPQDPVLFSGTIRSNLDPFGNIDDSELQWALEGSGLTATGGVGTDSGVGSENTSGTVTPMAADASGLTRKITLDTQVTAGGENLSQGQRQLLAFARALVRRSKLVILDEATSSTDHKTDERIQLTLKTSFPDSSILCIAHRLRTVMSFDRILVLDNQGNGGEVVEFDAPVNLLRRENGVLYNLAKKSGEFDELMRLACEVN
ncbi:hypothetical protein BDZ91DRAFT_689962 [Kalaharituber pfeilii]|nr:hypothetical protein BDZ91DRAFT_689962 [Kalaharituber pfeilii]